MSEVVIVDVDDTTFDRWTYRPIQNAKEVLLNLKKRNYYIVFVTGRFIDPTELIKESGFPCDTVVYRGGMPFKSWFLTNTELKQRVLALLKGIGANVVLAIDDSPENIAMYRQNGVNAFLISKPDDWKNVSF